MSAFFLETSALVKRYVQETGTAWVQSLAASAMGHRLYIAQIAAVETIAAITLRQRRGSTTAQEAMDAITDFRRDYPIEYASVQIAPALIGAAMDIAEKHGLRGYDSVQLAAGLQVHTEHVALGLSRLTFVSPDGSLNAAAVAEGMTWMIPISIREKITGRV